MCCWLNNRLCGSASVGRRFAALDNNVVRPAEPLRLNTEEEEEEKLRLNFKDEDDDAEVFARATGHWWLRLSSRAEPRTRALRSNMLEVTAQTKTQRTEINRSDARFQGIDLEMKVEISATKTPTRKINKQRVTPNRQQLTTAI